MNGYYYVEKCPCAHTCSRSSFLNAKCKGDTPEEARQKLSLHLQGSSFHKFEKTKADMLSQKVKILKWDDKLRKTLNEDGTEYEENVSGQEDVSDSDPHGGPRKRRKLQLKEETDKDHAAATAACERSPLPVQSEANWSDSKVGRPRMRSKVELVAEAKVQVRNALNTLAELAQRIGEDAFIPVANVVVHHNS